MFRKFTALLMLTTFTHAFAMTPVQETSAMSEALSRTFDEMNYSLNVEWDQKDQTFFNATVDGFENQIKSLQEQGLTNKELIDYTLTQIKDKQTQKDITEIANVINEAGLTGEQARDFALEKLNGTYNQGTSWSGHRLGVKMVLIVGVLILICCAVKKKNHKRDRDNNHCRPEMYDREFSRGGWDGCDNYYPTAA